ncbi:BsuPI-related putative proteinase inhibitor [Heyndrickxia acidiproducens]|uniref:BsuPI-related putative proteinase inhibitor n=1 Tax=Heyndrickxia acidiproducens TaxID=1121084 RepID=UPI0012DE9FCC|nr:BsuPI-related putative proteinase inhibitor [Heyndrickxia acidiproducens]
MPAWYSEYRKKRKYRQLRRWKAGILLALFAVFFSIPAGAKGDEKTMPDFTVKTAQNGSHLEISLTAANHSNEDIHLEFPTSKQYDFTVYNSQGQPLYTFSKGRLFLQAIQHITLEKGEEKTWKQVWKNAEAPGTYTVKAELLPSKINGKPGRKILAEQTFTIE